MESLQCPHEGHWGSFSSQLSRKQTLSGRSRREEGRGHVNPAADRQAMGKHETSLGNPRKHQEDFEGANAKQVGACANTICISRLVVFGCKWTRQSWLQFSHTEGCGLPRFSEQGYCQWEAYLGSQRSSTSLLGFEDYPDRAGIRRVLGSQVTCYL